jgi:hypothetical protein
LNSISIEVHRDEDATLSITADKTPPTPGSVGDAFSEVVRSEHSAAPASSSISQSASDLLDPHLDALLDYLLRLYAAATTARDSLP